MVDGASPSATFPADEQAQIVLACCDFHCAGPLILTMSFVRQLDAARLKRAARLLVDAEPILGCRFDRNAWRPVWRRRTDLDETEWCLVRSVDDPDTFIRHVLVPRPEHLEQTVRVYLLRHAGGDMVLLWLNHMIADSQAAGACAALLAEIYSRIGLDPDFRPEPDPAPRENEAWTRDMTVRDVFRIIRRDVRDAITLRGLVHGFQRDFETFLASKPVDSAFVKHRIPADAVAALDRAAKARRCTRNDMLTAAFLRAFPGFAWQGPRASAQVGITVDLRSYAPPRARYPMCSMVGMARITAGRTLGATFDDTLARVTAALDWQKKSLMGAANPWMITVMALMPFRWKRAITRRMIRRVMRRPMIPTFSNAGRLNADGVRFDGVVPADAGFVVYPAALPMFLVGALEYQGCVTLTCCFQPTDLAEDAVRALLERIVAELPIEAPADTAPAMVAA